MNNKKIIKSAFVTLGVAVIAAGASYAYFQDSARVLGTTFASGNADLKIKMPANDCAEWSDDCSGVSWSGIYPGWNQSYDLSLKNISDSPIILQIIPVIEETGSSQGLWDNTFMEIVCTGNASTGRYNLSAWENNVATEVAPRLSQNQESGTCQVKFDVPLTAGNEIANGSISFNLILNANQVGEGTVDGEDTCVPSTEVCDGQDNDCDGQTIDEASACGSAESSCTDGIDNDSDNKIDCADPGCYYNSLDCVAPVCGDGTCRASLETYANCPADCPAPAPECTTNNDCNNDKPCTTDTCVNGSCVHTPNNNMCAAQAGNSCLLSTCVGASGDMWGCSYQASANIGSSCSSISCGLSGGCNGATCNAQGACVAPAQAPPTGCANCDDNNSCTADSCVSNACQHINIVPGQCIFGGTCTNGAVTCNANPNCPNNCDDGNACTTDACDITGCSHTATPNTLNCGNSAYETCNTSTGQHGCECYLTPLNYPNCSITLPTWPF